MMGFQYCDPWEPKLKIEKQKVVFERKKFPIFQIRNLNLKHLLIFGIFFLRIERILNWNLLNFSNIFCLFESIKSLIFESNSSLPKKFYSFVTRKDIGFGKVVAFLLDLPIGEFFNQTMHMEVKIVASCTILSTNGMTLVVVCLIVANLYAKYYLENVWCTGHFG